jgi:hypothetical protein
MRSNLKVIALMAGISALALVACNERPKPATVENAARTDVPAKPGNLARIDVDKGHPPKPDKACKDADRKLDAIVIEMTDLQNLDPAHVTQWHEQTDKNGNEPDGIHIGDPLPPMKNGHTAADVDAGPFLKNKNDVVLIQLMIKDQPDLKFPSDPIVTDDADNGQMFCVKSSVVIGADGKTANFYVSQLKGVSPKALIGLYTFSYENGRAQIVRTKVDPSVENDGIQ